PLSLQPRRSKILGYGRTVLQPGYPRWRGFSRLLVPGIFLCPDRRAAIGGKGLRQGPATGWDRGSRGFLGGIREYHDDCRHALALPVRVEQGYPKGHEHAVVPCDGFDFTRYAPRTRCRQYLQRH